MPVTHLKSWSMQHVREWRDLLTVSAVKLCGDLQYQMCSLRNVVYVWTGDRQKGTLFISKNLDLEPSASGRLQILPSGKQDRFAPLPTVPLRLSSDHWLFSRKSESQGVPRVFLLSFDFWYPVLVFLHSTQPPSGSLWSGLEPQAPSSAVFSEKGYADDRGMVCAGKVSFGTYCFPN